MQKVLLISSVWIEPNSSAAGSRMLQLIEVFQSQNWKITYTSTASKSDYAFDLSTLGIDYISIQLNNSNFDNLLKRLQPTIVVFDRFITEEQFGWRVAEICPNTLRVLDTEDLHCLRKAREITLKNNTLFQEKDILKTEIAKREIASILRCDISLIISTYEMKILQNLFKIDIDLLHYIPFLLDSISTNFNQTPSFEERTHFYFVGNFLHKPNVDAVLFLKNKIWPKLAAKLPKAELHIYGAYPTQQITELENKKERFLIKGRATNLQQIIQQSRVCLAPLRFGAGIKGKLIEAMQNGTPSITTNIGSEAMHKNLKWSGIIANNIDEIVDAAYKLYTDKNIWKIAQQNGAEIINQVYNKEEHAASLLQKIKSTQKNLKNHRLNNFIGELLQYHTLKSTKYLSKWIEAKSKY